MTADAVARLCQSGASESKTSSSIVEVKIGGLSPYRDRILRAIRSSPGCRGIRLSAIIERAYGVRIHHQALMKYIVREGLFDAAAVAGGPIRSRAKQVHAKIANPRRYRHGKVAPMKGRVGEPVMAMKSMKYDAGAATNAPCAFAARLERLEAIVRTTMTG